MKTELKDFTVISVTFTKESKIKIRYERNSDEVLIPLDGKQYPYDQAFDYVKERGFIPIGIAEGFHWNYIICEREINKTLKSRA